MQEIFKDIPEYEGLYQVSNLGNVKSLAREMVKGKRKFISKEKILKLGKDGAGYYFVNLYKNGKIKNFKIHKLVAITFLNHIPDRYRIVVDHIDNNPLNNRLENLQLISQRQNTSKDRINGSSKYIGIYWNKKANKWMALISINGKRKYLGIFSDELDAHEAYKKELKKFI
jgi:hypothetical protein